MLAAMLVFLSGGIAALLAHPLLKREPTCYQLTRPLDLSESYFFNQEARSPAVGILQPGTTICVEGRHSRAFYVSISTVIDEEVLRAHSKPAR